MGSILLLFLLPLAGMADVREGSSSIDIRVVNSEGRVLPPEENTRLRIFVHEGRPNHRSIPTCQVTQDDRVETYELGGWHLPTDGLTYFLNTRRAPDEVAGGAAEAIVHARETWARADQGVALRDGGTTEISRPRYDGRNVILWRLLSRQTIAVAYIWYHPATGEVLDADMVFNSRIPWEINDPAAGDCGGNPAAYDLQAVASHEIGHWLGLDDLYGAETKDLTMHGFVTTGELKKVTLGEGDVQGVHAVAP